MHRLATMHSVTNRGTDGRTDGQRDRQNSIMPIADRTEKEENQHDPIKTPAALLRKIEWHVHIVARIKLKK